MVFVDDADQVVLEQELKTARALLGWGIDDVFKHTNLVRNAQAHQEFYAAIRRVPSFAVRVYQRNRREWALRHVRARRGDPCVCDSIIELILGCPDAWIADQVMYIDIPRKGGLPIIEAFRTAMRQSLRTADRRSFSDIKPRPDDRLDSGLVQAADMIAGE